MNIVRLEQKRARARRSARASDRANAQGRDIPFALVAVALMIAGVAAGARQELLPTQAIAAPAQALTVQFDYFPSHYVNQGAESAEEYPTF